MAITQGATMVASATADDRSYEQQLADDETKASIEKALLEQNSLLAEKVDIDVYRGRVMLTGVVAHESERWDAVSITRGAVADATVYDDIQISSGGGLADATADFAANKNLGARLLETEGLGSQSFQHRVVNGVAYIMGQASSVSQVELARQTALGSEGVQQVVTHIVVVE
jgi:osmotically-inducible protein OsmY